MNIVKEKEYPLSIFKYCNLNTTKHFDNLIKNQIWLSSPLNFNDPYDCTITYDYDKIQNIMIFDSIKELIEDFSEAEMPNTIKQEILSSDNPIKNLISWVNKFLQNSTIEVLNELNELNKNRQYIEEFILTNFNELYRKKLKVSSFSEYHQSLLMWGHYTNNHEGFCIEYDLSSMDDNENLKKYLFPVKYCNERFDITDFYIDNVINKKNIGINRLIHSVLYKSEDWAYEKEWRFVITESEYGEKTLSTPKPKAIYLGSKIKAEHKQQFIKVCRKNDIAIFQMKLDSTMYKINEEKI